MQNERGYLLILASEDGNEKSAVLYIAIVTQPESTEEWTWFIEHCRQHIPMLDDPNVGIISDRNRGLISAMSQTLMHSHHMWCAKHLERNVIGNKDIYDFKKDLFWSIVQAPNVFECGQN